MLNATPELATEYQRRREETLSPRVQAVQPSSVGGSGAFADASLLLLMCVTNARRRRRRKRGEKAVKVASPCVQKSMEVSRSDVPGSVTRRGSAGCLSAQESSQEEQQGEQFSAP